MKQLLIERLSTIEVPKQSIIESIQKNDGKLIIPNVLLQRADKPNRNSRVYPKRVLDKALNEYFSKIKEKRGFGECDHPHGDLANTISLKNVCQAIIDARWVGNEIYGDVEILNTPSGNIVKEILKAGYRVGQSSRGMGSVNPLHESEDSDLVEVSDDFEFLTLADCVSDPSTHNADMVIGENKVNILNYTENRFDSIVRDILCEMGNHCCIK